MCGKSSVVCANCLLHGVLKCQNLAVLSENVRVVVPQHTTNPVESCVSEASHRFSEYPYQNPYQSHYQTSSTSQEVIVNVPDSPSTRDDCSTAHGGSSPSVNAIQFSPDTNPSPYSTPEHWLESFREDVENEIEELKNSKRQYENYLEDQYLHSSYNEIDEPQPINLPQPIDELQVHYPMTGQFKGRGPNNVYEDDNSTVSMILKMESQFNLWLRNQKDECISHQCKDLFNKLSTKDDISNIDTLMRGAIESTSSKLPMKDSTRNIDKLLVEAIDSTSGTFTGSGSSIHCTVC